MKFNPLQRNHQATGDVHAEKRDAVRRAWEYHLPLICAIGLPLLFLLPFVNKAYHIDDTIFIWIGRQIQQHPLDFFGFIQNWDGTDHPMSLINKNPPGVSFYLAVVTALIGEREFLVHIAFLPIAVAISLGTFLIGQQVGLRPWVAAIAAASCVFAPAYLVSCTNVMSDPLMVAWYVWAVFLWIRGTETKRFTLLALSGMCIACSVISKYFGLSAVPLLLAYSIFRQRRPDWRWCALLIPIVVVAGYELWTIHLYGRGLFLDAASYVQSVHQILSEEELSHLGSALASLSFFVEGLSYLGSALVGLSFTGGCMIAALCFAPVLLSWRGLAVLVGIIVCFMALPPWYPLRHAGAIRGWFLFQWVIFVMAGLSIFALSIADVWKRRDAVSVLLLCWVGGTFLFSTVANWAINARSVFPMAPAVGLLIARQIEGLLASKPGAMPWRFFVPLVPAACLALCVTWADYTLANAARDTAYQVKTIQQGRPGGLWYAGHWGFQYYMEQLGAKAIDYKKPQMVPGDLMVFPQNNSGVYDSIPKEDMSLVRVLRAQPCTWMSTMRLSVGAGFYYHMWGPLPYVFADVPAEDYYIVQFRRP
jgi:4-amino-4-deoxy-L-arabinose transferase-like glycosyltransferase